LGFELIISPGRKSSKIGWHSRNLM
jgi:hypothetical protein